MLRLALPPEKLSPLKERILAAMASGPKGYHAVMREVFPEEHFPQAFRRASKGGPPGAAVAFGRALRELGICSTRRRGFGHGTLYFPPTEEAKRKTGYDAKKAKRRALERKVMAADGARIEAETGFNPDKAARHLVANLLRQRRAKR